MRSYLNDCLSISLDLSSCILWIIAKRERERETQQERKEEFEGEKERPSEKERQNMRKKDRDLEKSVSERMKKGPGEDGANSKD